MCTAYVQFSRMRTGGAGVQYYRTSGLLFLFYRFVMVLVIQYGLSMDGDSDEVFPAEDHLFKDSFSADKIFTFFGHEFIINEVFAGNFGVAASV